MIADREQRIPDVEPQFGGCNGSHTSAPNLLAFRALSGRMRPRDRTEPKGNDMCMRYLIVAVLIVPLLAACPGHKNVECRDDGSCDLSAGGVCVGATTGNMWCAYPDAACPGGFRYSDKDVGDNLGGQCVPATDAGVSNLRTLTIQVGGSGAGVVSSTPTGIACGSGTCTKTFEVGTQVMLASSASSGDFLGWSDGCMGQGACAVTLDTDRTVTALFGAFGEALWSQQIGAEQDDGANAIAVTTDDYVVVVGSFQGVVTVGTTTLTSAGSSDVFVAKLSAATGVVAWIKRFGGTGNDGATAVAVDSSNDIYIGGSFRGSVDFGGGAVAEAGNGDGFVVKLDSAGSYVWGKYMAGPFGDGVTGIDVHGTTVAAVGVYANSMTVNGTTLTNSGTQQGYLVQWGTNGSNGLVKGFPGANNTLPKAVALDSSDNIIVAGVYNLSADFGGGTMTSTGGTDVFLVKYGPTGTFLFQKVLGGSSNDNGGAVTVDASDNILLVGSFTGNIPFGGASPLNTNSNNMVVAKYSLAGSYQWAQAFGTTTAQVSPTAASANASGDVVVAGYFCGNLQMGSQTLSSVGTCPVDTDIFSARLSRTDGSPITAARAGGGSSDAAYGVTQASDGRHFIAGSFKGFAEFGGVGRTSAGLYDAVVLGLAPL